MTFRNMIYRFFKKPAPEKTKVVVLGNQKAGTSVVTHLIADYAGLTKTVDIPELWWPTLGKLLSGEIDLSNLCHKYPKRFFLEVVKEPNMTFFYHDLIKIYTKAQFLFVVRDPRDNIRSLLNRIDVPGDLIQLYPDTYPIDILWRHLFDLKLYDFKNVSHYIDILSMRWNRIADVYIQNKEMMVGVRYEDFCKAKVKIVEQIATTLRLPKVNDISKKVDIQYQPKGDRETSWIDFFGKVNLARIEKRCRDRMTEFEYETIPY